MRRKWSPPLDALEFRPAFKSPTMMDGSEMNVAAADLHTLFDLGLLNIAPDSHTVVVSCLLEGSSYWNYYGEKINLPQRKADWPSTAALVSRLKK